MPELSFLAIQALGLVPSVICFTSLADFVRLRYSTRTGKSRRRSVNER